MARLQGISANLNAVLDTLAASEGTRLIPNSDEGYLALIGGRVFSSYSTHPNPSVWIQRIGQYSSAAGRYQLLYRYWQVYQKQLSLPDFSPTSQDLIAVTMLGEVGALADIEAGNFSSAIAKAGKRWSSLPCSQYGQTIRTFDQVKAWYVAAGGGFASS